MGIERNIQSKCGKDIVLVVQGILNVFTGKADFDIFALVPGVMNPVFPATRKELDKLSCSEYVKNKPGLLGYVKPGQVLKIVDEFYDLIGL